MSADSPVLFVPCRGEATAPKGFELLVNGIVVTSPATVVPGDVLQLRRVTEKNGQGHERKNLTL